MPINQEDKAYIRDKFAAMQTKEDLVNLLSEAKDMRYRERTKPFKLNYFTYYANPKLCKQRYKTFTISKKSGGQRVIHAPVMGLNFLLQSVNFVLNCMYEPHKAATGFVPEKSIVDNARGHAEKPFVYNIDLQDFFHSFGKPRVKYGFMRSPFNLNGDREYLAFLLASLCTHPFEVNGEVKRVLPMGSPTSPTITNILCHTLDRRLNGLAKRFGATYSRYADDITFSSIHNIYRKKDFQKELYRIVEANQGLKIKPEKTRLQKEGYRKEATGLVVNEKVNVKRRYVKDLRKWLYLWEKYGNEKAQQLFTKDYVADKGHVKKGEPNLENVLDGKLDFMKMVKGVQDGTYLKLRDRFDKLTQQSSTSNSKKVSLDDVLDTILNQGLIQGIDLYQKLRKP
ncbi:MAG: RNA-directed DNA polymerase [Bacteroidetes bacterium SW_10_40_5]|nr:MAG: RNA-directed DNA polymerase [Bacteroidetes bacterium SW_10_40_5]